MLEFEPYGHMGVWFRFSSDYRSFKYACQPRSEFDATLQLVAPQNFMSQRYVAMLRPEPPCDPALADPAGNEALGSRRIGTCSALVY